MGKNEYFLRILYILGDVIWTLASNQLEYQEVIGAPLRRAGSDLALLENRSVLPCEGRRWRTGPQHRMRWSQYIARSRS